MRAAGPFARLWAGQTVSVLGTSVSALAIPTLAILVLHVTPFAFSVLQAAEFAAFPLVGVFAGVLIDRWSRRRTMLITDVIRALLLATIPLAAMLHVLTFAQLFAVAILVGAASVFFELAYSAYVPALVSAHALETANSRLEATNSGARLAGSGIAGALISVLGAPLVVVLDAASYIVSAVLLFSLHAPEPHLTDRPPSVPFLASLREGFRYVMQTPYLRATATATTCSNLAFGIVGAVLLLFEYRTLHFTPWIVGLLGMIGNVGFVGALAAPALGRRFGARTMIAGSYATFSFGTMFLPLAGAFAPFVMIALSELIFTTSVPIYNISQISIRQRIVPAELLGRVSSVMRTAVLGVIPIGALLGGVCASTIGIVPTLWIVVGITALGLLPLVGLEIPADGASTSSA